MHKHLQSGKMLRIAQSEEKTFIFLARDFGGPVETNSHLFPKIRNAGPPLLSWTTLTHLRGVFAVFSQAFQLWCIEKEQQEKERLVLLLQFCTGSHLNPLPVFFVLRIFRLFHYLCILCRKKISIVHLS